MNKSTESEYDPTRFMHFYHPINWQIPPKFQVNAVAPIRICDIGGWTDTWFAKNGAVLNFAVYPQVEVQISTHEATEESGGITINAENYGDSYIFDRSNQPIVFAEEVEYFKHPLIEAAVDAMGIAKNKELTYEISIYSSAPPGASTGTSAAVSVALISALDKLTEGRMTAHEIAMKAHSIETDHLHLQCGVQDQLASAYGGINFIEMHDFPNSTVSPVHIPDRLWLELQNRMAVIYVGEPHKSSEIHQMVIKSLERKSSKGQEVLERLSENARNAKTALLLGDLFQFAQCLNVNTMLQEQLHSKLVSRSVKEIMKIAYNYGAIAGKVNGAGGDGGSVTILFSGDRSKKRKCIEKLEELGYKYLYTPFCDHGVRTWEGFRGMNEV